VNTTARLRQRRPGCEDLALPAGRCGGGRLLPSGTTLSSPSGRPRVPPVRAGRFRPLRLDIARVQVPVSSPDPTPPYRLLPVTNRLRLCGARHQPEARAALLGHHFDPWHIVPTNTGRIPARRPCSAPRKQHAGQLCSHLVGHTIVAPGAPALGLMSRPLFPAVHPAPHTGTMSCRRSNLHFDTRTRYLPLFLADPRRVPCGRRYKKRSHARTVQVRNTGFKPWSRAVFGLTTCPRQGRRLRELFCRRARPSSLNMVNKTGHRARPTTYNRGAAIRWSMASASPRVDRHPIPTAADAPGVLLVNLKSMPGA